MGSIFKFKSRWDNNGIYNDLAHKPPRMFNDLLSRVEDDDRTANIAGFKREMNGNGDRHDDDQGKKNKKEERYNGKRSNTFKGINTIFNKPIHKIMFKIQGKQFFKWPKPMAGNSGGRDTALRCSYHKDHGHRTKNCKTLK